MSATLELGNRIPVELVPTEQRIAGLAAILRRHIVGKSAFEADLKAERLARELLATGDIRALLWDLGKAPNDPDVRKELALEIQEEVMTAQKEWQEREDDARIAALCSAVESR